MKWSKYLDERDTKDITLAHQGEIFTIESLTISPRLIQHEHDRSVMGIQLIVTCGELEVARETHWGVAILGDPNDTLQKQFLEEVLSDLAPEAIYQAHINIRAMQKQTEAYLKTLRETREKMSNITLIHGGNQIVMSLGMAQQVLFIKLRDRARETIRPFRFQRERPDVAIVYDDLNRVMGRIGFNPEVEAYRTSQGKFGLYNLLDTQEDFNG